MNHIQRVLFIRNPFAGPSKKSGLEQLIQELNPSYSFEIIKTEGPYHATELAQTHQKNFDLIVAVGGDGTINEVASGLVGSETALGMIPLGSGNGYARGLKIPLRMRNAVKLIETGQIKAVDVGKLNGKYFFNVCGFGFEAEISKEFQNLKKRGLPAYINLVLNKVQKMNREYHFNLTEGERVRKLKGIQLSCGIGQQYGNNAFFAPKKEFDSGKFLFVCVEKLKPLATLQYATALFQGKTQQMAEVHTFEADAVSIQTNAEFAHLDAEAIELPGEVMIELVPKALKVLVPANS